MSIVKMAGIVKRFGAVLANDHVDLDLEAGEIHALLGENGAGKTTLMNVLSGLYMPDEGEITVDGQRCHIDSPRKALALGIGMVHQHFMLASPLTVAENIVLGMKTSRSPLLGLRDAEERIRQLSAKYHLQVDPKAYIWQLSAGERQRVEILKLLYREANILILDEPTAVLTPGEAGEMYLVVREMARQGHAVVLISHKLEEVTAWANRITVLRDGRVVDTVKGNVTRPELARMMVGREVLFQYQRATQTPGEVVLSLQHVTARGPGGRTRCARYHWMCGGARSWGSRGWRATVRASWPTPSPGSCTWRAARSSSAAARSPTARPTASPATGWATFRRTARRRACCWK